LEYCIFLHLESLGTTLLLPAAMPHERGVFLHQSASKLICVQTGHTRGDKMYIASWPGRMKMRRLFFCLPV